MSKDPCTHHLGKQGAYCSPTIKATSQGFPSKLQVIMVPTVSFIRAMTFTW